MTLESRIRRIYWISLLLTLYMVLPFGDLPLLGVSLSAPLAVLLVLELTAVSGRFESAILDPWITWAAIFWLLIALTLVGNVLQGRVTRVELNSVVLLVQFALWLAVSLSVSIIFSHFNWQRMLANLLGVGVMIVAFLRFAEVILYGNWGSPQTHFLPRNSYGLIMSAFNPFAAVLLFQAPRKWRWAVWLGGIVLLGAVIGNLSRSTWISTTVCLVIGTAMVFSVKPSTMRYLWLLLVLPLVLAALFFTLPDVVVGPIVNRFETFDKLEQEKSYLLRQLMVEKGKELFRANPLFGAGIGRFRQEWVELELPRLIREWREERYNTKSPHNSYMGFLGETGLCGAVPFGLFLLALVSFGLWAAWAHARRGEWWAFAIYTGFLGMSIHFWSIAGMMGTMPWFMYGMCAGIIQREQIIRKAELARKVAQVWRRPHVIVRKAEALR